MTLKAKRFLEANKKSPVVYGSVNGQGGQGCYYRLQDGSTFDLNADDCRAIVGNPRWSFDLVGAD